MKKIIAAFAGFLLCAAAFATDIRQVMFGNNYETIKEIDSEKFFEKYPESKIINRDKFEERGGWKEKYYRVYEQVIGDKTFYRLQASPDELTDDYIRNWRNPDEDTNRYRVQLFMEDGDYLIAVLDTCVMNYDWEAWEHGTTKEYDFVEIIQRNNKVKGFLYTRLVDKIDRHDRIEEYHRVEETYINTAEYYLFDDVMNNATENFKKVKYARKYSNLRYVSIKASQPLVDSKRPFMYTLQNAFDGNPATAYVEDTKDDTFELNVIFRKYNEGHDREISSIRFINGYAASEQLYFDNNRFSKISFMESINSEDEEEKDKLRKIFWESYKDVTVPDSREIYIYKLSKPIRFNSFTFISKGVVKGNKYSDTCLAEFDVCDSEQGWIFGDVL